LRTHLKDRLIILNEGCDYYVVDFMEIASDDFWIIEIIYNLVNNLKKKARKFAFFFFGGHAQSIIKLNYIMTLITIGLTKTIS